jgi:hypothetical protein
MTRWLSAVHAIMFFGGVALVSTGAGLIYRPAGLIVLGASCVATAIVGALRARGEPEE